MKPFTGFGDLYFHTDLPVQVISAGRQSRSGRLFALCVALLAVCALILPLRAAHAEGSAPPEHVTTVTVQTSAQAADNAASGALIISGWQGAKNFQDRFPIKIDGGFNSGTLRFLTNNCSVSPGTGTAEDVYTVTVTGAGTYSMTAIMSDSESQREISESCSGIAGKADQEPLAVTGWGNARNYYRTFTIQVSGGTTKGSVRFDTDGCSVYPVKGNVNSVFTVTVTRVGAYSLTAVMDGNSNYSEARSARYTGMSGKSDQASIMIGGWVSTAYYGDTFPVKISGGSTNEALTIEASGCEIVRDSGHDYTVTVTSVGPYSITATRAGSYGYNAESTSMCGVSKRATQPGISIVGWATNKNVADAFAIRVKGGMSGGLIHFATTGCTIKPESGTTDDTFIVTVDTVGAYTLTAKVDGNESYHEAVSRQLEGTAGKAVQTALNIADWKENAPHGDSFDVTVQGGNGSGAMSVTTNEGCVAVRKAGEEAVYTVTVTAERGEEYALTVGKSGDANYAAATARTLSGTAGKSAQSALNVNGWKDSSQKGDEFAIQIAGGSGEGSISFEAVGCKVSPETGDTDDVYQVIVTAAEGEAYSLAIQRAGDGVYANTSTLRSGSVRHSALNASHASEHMPEETETPLLGDGVDMFLIVGMLSILLVLLAIAIVLQYQQRHYRKR